MHTVDFETSLGVIPIRGLEEAFSRSHPAVLVITGAFAPESYMMQMPLLGEDRWDGFLSRLPGNQTPELNETSVDGFARAFDEVVAQLRRPVVVCGVSVGAVVALAMKRPLAILAAEPFLSTGGLWPLWPSLRGALDYDDRARFVEAIFGLTEAGVANRDYSHLLDDLAVPTDVVIGEIPLAPQRPWSGKMPSLVSEADRARFSAHKLIRVSVAPSAGHNLWWDAGRYVLGRLERLIGEHAKRSLV